MIQQKKRNNKLLLFISCLLTLCTTKSIAQCANGSAACDGSCPAGFAYISATQDDDNSCAFSISTTTSRVTNSCGLSCYIWPTCFGYCYGFVLSYKAPGATSFSPVTTGCSNSNTYTFSGLTAYGTYQVIDVYAVLMPCGGTGQCYIFEDVATINITDNVCGIINTLHSGSHPAYVQRTGEIAVDCSIANNTLTSIQSDQDIVFQNGTHLLGNSSPSTDVHAYIATCANYSREANTNGALNENNIAALTPPVYGNKLSSLNNNSVVFSVTPNPSNGNFTLHCNNLANDAILEVYDVQSKKVYSTTMPANTTSLDINNTELQNGVYLYKLIGQDNVLNTGRLVIIN